MWITKGKISVGGKEFDLNDYSVSDLIMVLVTQALKNTEVTEPIEVKHPCDGNRLAGYQKLLTAKGIGHCVFRALGLHEDGSEWDDSDLNNPKEEDEVDWDDDEEVDWED